MSAAASPALLATAQPELSPQLALLCAAASGAISEHVPENDAWPAIVETAEYHGLSSFLNRASLAAGAPIESRERLRSSVRREDAQNLLLTAELLDLNARFAGVGIKMVPFKGPVLAAQFYEAASDRPCSDLDIFVAKKDVIRARDVLIAAGYVPELPSAAERLEDYSRFACELNFRRGAHLRIELHWDIVPRQFALAYDPAELFSRTSAQTIGDVSLPCFAPSDNVFLLSVHAAKHGWCRLLWVLDIARLLDQYSATLEWPQILAQARAGGAERILLVSIALAHKLFGAEIPHALVPKVQQAAVGHVVDRVIAMLEAGMARERTPSSGEFEPSALWRHRTIVESRERRSDRLRYLFRLFTEPTEQELTWVRLPKPLWFGYSLIRFGHVTAKSVAAAWA